MTGENDFYVTVGDEVSFSKTVGEHDVYGFAGISGDFAPMHVDEAYMAERPFGGRIAHGALLVAYMSTASSAMCVKAGGFEGEETAVSLGYDRIRFVGPVKFGDTVTVRYVIASIDTERRRATADITVTTQDGATVAVATHVMKWVPSA